MRTDTHSSPGAADALGEGPKVVVEPNFRKVSFGDDFRRFFLRGLAAVLPTLITLLLLIKLWEILWGYVGQHIIWLIKLASARVHGAGGIGYVKWSWEQNVPRWAEELLGVILAIVLVYFVGLIVGNFLGRTAWRLLEATVMRVPLIRAIYPAVKQVTDFVLADRKSQIQASRVVAVRPHSDEIWSIGLVTGPGLQSLSTMVGTDMVTVFIPSSPTSFSGYVLMVPRERVIELPLSVEEAMRLLVTGGVSGPGVLKPGELLGEDLKKLGTPDKEGAGGQAASGTSSAGDAPTTEPARQV
jgi:uncharacterized membrane protein